MQKAFLLVLVHVAGCVPVAVKSEGIRSTIDVTPKTPPNVAGGYDFELLDAVDGMACVSPGDTNTFSATIPGFEPSRGDIISQRAEGAAVYDAMNKAQNADTLLITWVKIVGEGTKKCATVHARGVRLKQAGAPPEAAPAPPAVEPGPQSAPVAAPPAS